MEILVLCEMCGKRIMAIQKDNITDKELRELERMCACEDHGRNEYILDENGALKQHTFIVKAIKMVNSR